MLLATYVVGTKTDSLGATVRIVLGTEEMKSREQAIADPPAINGALFGLTEANPQSATSACFRNGNALRSTREDAR